ncbi:MAG TPA: SH3 domain-containing protein [Gammaproteobacteria bacterium]|nr:SH3 domain-containing protein [Gammaproteobacteria bacterium]
MNIRRWLIALFSLLLPLAVAAATGSNAQTIQITPMNRAPYSDAQALAQLPVNTRLHLVERKGGWYHVRLGNGKQGWVRMTSIRLGEGSEAPSTSGWSFGSLTHLFQSGRANTTEATATTGVRGLNEGSIQNAVPDTQAVAGLSRYAATPDAARKYAAKLKLKSKQVGYLSKDAQGGK